MEKRSNCMSYSSTRGLLPPRCYATGLERKRSCRSLGRRTKANAFRQSSASIPRTESYVRGRRRPPTAAGGRRGDSEAVTTHERLVRVVRKFYRHYYYYDYDLLSLFTTRYYIAARAQSRDSRYLGVEEKLAPIRLREQVVMLKSDHRRQTDHFRAQHEHAEHGHQREHAYDFTVRLQTCEREMRKKKKVKK